MIELIIVRHGETDWNADEVFRGRADIELNSTGIRQAELAGEYLSRKEIDFIYSSPLKRAMATAGSIASHHGLDVNTISNLNDMDFGEWQGQSRQEVSVAYPDVLKDWEDTPEQVRIPGGECLEDVARRVLPFIEDAVMRCGEGRLVLVSHRVVCKVAVCGLLGMDLSHFRGIRIDNCGITRFDCGDGRLVLREHNNTSFLLPLQYRELGDF